jgi:hypothetical protein
MSPFADLPNATITLEIPTGGVVRDRDGNPQAETTALTVTAYLKKQKFKSSSKQKNLPGVDELAIELEGYCIEPQQLPRSFKGDAWAKCEWSGNDGWLYIESPIGGKFGRDGIGAILDDAIGTNIEGFFQVRKMP